MMGQPVPWIAGLGTALPGAPIDNETLSQLWGVSEPWIDAFIGTRTRHFAVDLATGKQHATLADLAEQAGTVAMRHAGVVGSDVDFVVLATASPDQLMPATVNLVADRLGIDQVPTYQLQAGCAGAVQALELGALLLTRPQHRVGLVIGGDVCARHLRLDEDISRLPAGALINYVLFGDAAGAAVLVDEPAPAGLALTHVVHQLTGRHQAPGQVVRWFGAADRDRDVPAAEEDYKAIEQRVPVLAAEVLAQLFDLTGWAAEDVTYLLPPQLSGRMTKRITAHLGLTGAFEISCVADTGNTGNALPFLQLDRLAERIGPGDRALAVCVESSKWIRAGFAVEADDRRHVPS